MLDYFQRKNPLKEKIKGKIEQGGVGYYSLCSSCNNFLGREYVESYTKYSNSFIYCGKSPNNLFVLDMHNFEALRVIKQIASMFLSINSPEFALSEPELREFVLNPSNKTLPEKFRFFAYTNFEGSIRNIGITVRGSFTTGNDNRNGRDVELYARNHKFQEL